MTKRRAEDTLFHDAPSKRCYRSLCSIDMQLESMAAAGGVNLNPPSLLALLGNRCRKRPYYFEDREELQQEAAPHRKTTHCDRRTHAEHGLSVQTSGNFQDRRTSATLTGPKKRPREDGVASHTTSSPAAGGGANDDSNNEDSNYNSFQYWRVPLPELDLSLLEDADNQSDSREKSKVKDSSSDAMET